MRGRSFPARLEQGAGSGVRARVSVGTFPELPVESRQAMALLLLSAGRSVRMARAAAEEGDGASSVSFEVLLPEIPSPTVLAHALSALWVACELCGQEDHSRDAALRDRLLRRLSEAIPDLLLNGHRELRLPQNLHVSIPGVSCAPLMAAVPEVAVSAGAACASGDVDPSHVLKAMGFDGERAGSAIRFGIGRFNTEEEINSASDLFVAAVRKLRADRG